MSATSKVERSRFINSLRFPLILLAIMWGIHLVQFLTGLDFGSLGIYPRKPFGLRGILLCPLIHGDWQHIISNSPPFFVLAVMLFYFYPKVALRSFVMIYLLTGLAVWLFGRNVFHIGASGVIYGLVAFVFWTGIFRRSLRSIVLALVVLFLYSGLFVGVVPNEQQNISWESHLMGALVGIFTAYWYKEDIERDENPPPPSWEEDESARPYFLDRDTFEKTMKQREEAQKQDPDSWFSSHT
ncbi:MAG: rhomboid family intramembrane serine protease [Saprospirales bacterium]|nr:rhomboid family intramembrane serine protease [Saprospirales bacterium]MBK8489981.1 rhomboid family intramembrane serine protease [Saprospirales bacterium]